MKRMVMKMAAVSTISLLLLLCCWAVCSTGSQDACEYAAAGSDFLVPLNYQLGASESLTWKHNEKIVFSRRKANMLVGKKEDIDAEGTLRLINVKKSHEGKYIPEVFDTNGKKKDNLKSTTVCVLDRVLKPTVKSECMKTAVKFTCLVTQNSKELTFRWLQGDKVLEKEKGPVLVRTEKQVEPNSFRCNVSNQVSLASSEAAAQTCFSRKFGFLPDTLFGIDSRIVVSVGAAVVVLLIAAVIICCVCNRRKRRMQMKDEGELRLAWTNEQQRPHNCPPDHQHHHHQHHQQHQQHQQRHHHHQQPAGHTGPRQPRAKQQRDLRPRAPDHGGAPQPSPRRPAQAPRPPPGEKTDEEQPPPLPQPRKKAPKAARVFSQTNQSNKDQTQLGTLEAAMTEQ